MAKPRVFISSTFYDLRTIRDDLDRFVRIQGFEPVRHEAGQVSYGKDEAPENYAYREIDLCDILVCIIGGKFGSTSSLGGSITQNELRNAFTKGKQVYVFVEDNVQSEYRYYSANKNVSGITYTAVDNPKIYNFLDEIYSLPQGNPIFTFSISADITQILQEQWAGLFERLLREYGHKKQATLIDELQRGLNTVDQLVQYLSEQNLSHKTAIDEILLANHPVFKSLRDEMNNPYRVYFTNIEELTEWVEEGKSYTRVFSDEPVDEGYFVWQRIHSNKKRLNELRVTADLFNQDGALKPMTLSNWREGYVSCLTHDIVGYKDDDIPF